MEPFHLKTPSFRYGLIKPSKAIYYNPQDGYPFENPSSIHYYFYDTNGRLLKERMEMISDNEILVVSYSDKFPNSDNHYYNLSFMDNYVDTVTYYQKDNIEPVQRAYYEYEIEREEAPYIAFVVQLWNKAKERWDNIEKRSSTYLDTVSWYETVWELYDSDVNNNFKLYYKETNSLIYDENNNVSQVINERTNIVDTAKTIYEYYYPANAHDNLIGYDSIYIYNYDSNSEFSNAAKQTDIIWHRWDGFDYASNLMASFYGWHLNQDDTWVLWGQQKYWYDVDGIAGSRIDTVYFYSDLYERWYTKAVNSRTFSEKGNFCGYGVKIWKDLELSGGVPEFYGYSSTHYDNEYNKDDLLWRYTRYDSYFSSTQPGDNYEDRLSSIWEVTEFIDVTANISDLPQNNNHLLSIFPNPVSGIVTISASAEMQQLSIFDITGRMVANPLPTGERAIFDTGALPQGVYLVRALLKDGGMRTGKVVVR
ncbi:MAG: T9SS type A sorting domain-containing protein [Bacteroidales bacterium]|nr:T9SS type A sorting domain-containing protein [Bacteroidales bacterium]